MDKDSFPYKQPLDGSSGYHIRNNEEILDYLPGTRLRIWCTDHDNFFPMHWHNAMEIITSINGYYLIKTDTEEYEIHEGEIMFIPPGIMHTFQPSHKCQGFVYLMDTNILTSIQSAISVLPFLMNPIFLSNETNPSLHVTASSLLGQMRNEYFSKNTMRELIVYSIFLTLVAEIGYYYGADSNNQHRRLDKRCLYSEKFNEVIYYINEHYMEDLSVESVAKMFGFSKYHFSRLFKQYTQFTFCDYLSHRRMKAAEYYLSQPNMTITDVAFKSGFSSISSFGRAFKDIKNCTPTEYKAIYAK